MYGTIHGRENFSKFAFYFTVRVVVFRRFSVTLTCICSKNEIEYVNLISIEIWYCMVYSGGFNLRSEGPEKFREFIGIRKNPQH